MDDDNITNFPGEEASWAAMCAMDGIEDAIEDLNVTDAESYIDGVWDFVVQSCQEEGIDIPSKEKAISELEVMIVEFLKSYYGDIEVCAGNTIDGLDIDLIEYCSFETINDEQIKFLWSRTNDLELVKGCDHGTLVEIGKTHIPLHSSVDFSLMTFDEQAFKAELRQRISAIINSEN